MTDNELISAAEKRAQYDPILTTRVQKELTRVINAPETKLPFSHIMTKYTGQNAKLSDADFHFLFKWLDAKAYILEQHDDSTRRGSASGDFYSSPTWMLTVSYK